MFKVHLRISVKSFHKVQPEIGNEKRYANSWVTVTGFKLRLLYCRCLCILTDIYNM